MPQKASALSLKRLAKPEFLIGSAIGLVGVVAGFLGYKSTWDVARISGALDKPIVSLGLGGVRLQPTETVDLLFGTSRLGEQEGPPSVAEITHSLSSGKSFDYSSYQTKSLNPGVGVTANEPFYIRETQLTTDAPFTTKDGVNGSVSITMRYSIQLLATVSGHDIPTTNYDIELAATHATSLDDLNSFAMNNSIPDNPRVSKKARILAVLGWPAI